MLFLCAHLSVRAQSGFSISTTGRRRDDRETKSWESNAPCEFPAARPGYRLSIGLRYAQLIIINSYAGSICRNKLHLRLDATAFLRAFDNGDRLLLPGVIPVCPFIYNQSPSECHRYFIHLIDRHGLRCSFWFWTCNLSDYRRFKTCALSN